MIWIWKTLLQYTDGGCTTTEPMMSRRVLRGIINPARLRAAETKLSGTIIRVRFAIIIVFAEFSVELGCVSRDVSRPVLANVLLNTGV